MIKTSRQLKDLIRNLSKEKSADAQILMRNYMMERFLERVSKSEYKEHFILKGGMLVAAMVGLDARSTMDIDATIRGKTIGVEEVKQIVADIIATQVDDNVEFHMKSVSSIMDEAEYPGIRVSMDTIFDGVRTPLKIDFSTGDVITPREIRYSFRLMFEDRSIDVLAYNLETVLAEKIETVLARATTNSRMRDFYDLHILKQLYGSDLDKHTLSNALAATAQKRSHSGMLGNAEKIISAVQDSEDLQSLWKNYQTNFSYAAEIPWSMLIRSLRLLCMDAGLEVQKSSVLAQLHEPIKCQDDTLTFQRKTRTDPER